MPEVAGPGMEGIIPSAVQPQAHLAPPDDNNFAVMNRNRIIGSNMTWTGSKLDLRNFDHESSELFYKGIHILFRCWQQVVETDD